MTLGMSADRVLAQITLLQSSRRRPDNCAGAPPQGQPCLRDGAIEAEPEGQIIGQHNQDNVDNHNEQAAVFQNDVDHGASLVMLARSRLLAWLRGPCTDPFKTGSGIRTVGAIGVY